MNAKRYIVTLLFIVLYSILFYQSVLAQLPIEVGDSLRYFKGTEEPPSDWKETTFNDSGWLLGPSGFGYGDGDDNTLLSDMMGNYSSIYVRKSFFINDPADVTGLLLQMDYDDGFVTYINGLEVARHNVGGNPPPFDTTANGNHEASAGGGVVSTFELNNSILVSGTNVLSVQGYNTTIGSSDFSLIPVLSEYFAINTNSFGNGTTTISPIQDYYEENDTILITASPNSGWFFSFWSGDHSSSVNPDTIIVTDNLTIEANFTEVNSVPNPPSGFEVLSVSTYSIELSWNDNAFDEDEYEIERSLVESGPYSLYATVPANSTQYMDPDVEKGTTYCYRISAKNPIGSSAIVGPICATTTTVPSFTIIGMPDTQRYTDGTGSPDIFMSQSQWIVDNTPNYNIVFVSHFGDCVQNGDNGGDDSEWLIVDTAISIIEDPVTTGMLYGMPYGLTVGNHDQSPFDDADGTTIFYNQYFGVDRFIGRDYYGGHYGSNNDNHFELFSAENMDFIVINLEFDLSPDSTVLNWADSVLQTHSDRRAIINSHYIIGNGNPANFGYQGQIIYDSLKHNSNLFLMLCGHIAGEGRRMDVYQGDTVYSLLADYQARANGGNGYLRIMEFFPQTNEISVKTYSPWLDVWETDANSEFVLKYDMQSKNCDIAVSPTSCGDFEVKLRPNTNYTNVITNIQFTLKWPENTVNLTNFQSDFGVTLQGSVEEDDGYNYAIFASTLSTPINWNPGVEYPIFSFSHDQSGVGYADFEIDTEEWAEDNDGEYFFELLGIDNSGIIYGQASNVYLGRCGQMDLKAFLEGPYDTLSGLMITSLNDDNYLPLSQPYYSLPWSYSGVENVATIPAYVTDWIFVELHDAPDALSVNQSSVISQQAAFLLNDGSIVGVDGSSFPEFNNSDLQNLFVILYHRNHLGILSSVEVIPSTPDLYVYDFTTSTSQVYGNRQLQINSNIYGMVSGDANSDGIVDLLDRIQLWVPFAGSVGYLNGDMNMDGQINNSDKNDLWFNNLFIDAQVPD